MSIEAAMEFREKVNASQALKDEVLKAFMGDGEGIIGVGKKYGYVFTFEEGMSLLNSTNGELNEIELELVAGGNSIDCNPNSNGAGKT